MSSLASWCWGVSGGAGITHKSSTHVGGSTVAGLLLLVGAGSGEGSGTAGTCQLATTTVVKKPHSPDELVREVALVVGVAGVGVEGLVDLVLVEEVEEAWMGC